MSSSVNKPSDFNFSINLFKSRSLVRPSYLCVDGRPVTMSAIYSLIVLTCSRAAGSGVTSTPQGGAMSASSLLAPNCSFLFSWIKFCLLFFLMLTVWFYNFDIIFWPLFFSTPMKAVFSCSYCLFWPRMPILTDWPWLPYGYGKFGVLKLFYICINY